MMIQQLIKPALIVYALAIPFWLIARTGINVSRRKQGKPISLKKEILWFISFLYATSVFIATVLPVPITSVQIEESGRINLVPVINTTESFLRTFSPWESYRRTEVLENILGNIVLFFPLGILLPLLSYKNHSFKRVFWISFAFSFLIEVTQFLSQNFGNYRYVDVDDIILNVAGGMLGFMLVRKWAVKNYRVFG